MTSLISSINIEGAGGWLQSLLNLNPIAVWCLVGPCDNLFWSLSTYDQRNGPLKIPVPRLALNEPSSQNKRRAEQPARQSWVIWRDTSEIGSPSLDREHEGNLPCLHPVRGCHCHAVPADQLKGCKTDRDPLQTTGAENGTPPPVPTVSAISEH